MELKVLPSECDCAVCSSMCQAPCCGTPSEVKELIKAGYAKRLCLDDWGDMPPDIHPALKGYESKKAPYAVSSYNGCTFWKNGKCELHDIGLKPMGGKYAHHDLTREEWQSVVDVIKDSWKTPEADEVIKLWIDTVNYK